MGDSPPPASKGLTPGRVNFEMVRPSSIFIDGHALMLLSFEITEVANLPDIQHDADIDTVTRNKYSTFAAFTPKLS